MTRVTRDGDPLLPDLVLRVTAAEAQALYDLVWFGVTGPADSRAEMLRNVADRLHAAGVAHSRLDFTGLVAFDDPDNLPGLF